MSLKGQIRSIRAFTLIEILLVMALIAILVVLALPAIANAKRKARQAECLNNLRHLGIAFHGFAHDHNDKFPMGVSTNAGGTLEFVEAAGTLGGNFFFAFRHFQALSNQLDSPRLLHCTVDNRPIAENFVSLRNTNISYLLSPNAQFEKPMSILAGDRNIGGNNWGTTVITFDKDDFPRWTTELHQSSGNILFSGGHVQQLTTEGLRKAIANSPLPETTVYVPVPAPVQVAAAGSGASALERGSAASSASAGGSKTPATPSAQPDGTKTGPSGQSQTAQYTTRTKSSPGVAGPGPGNPGARDLASKPALSSATSKASTNAGTAVGEEYAEGDNYPGLLGQYLGKTGARVTYGLLFLILAILVALEIIRRRKAKEKGNDAFEE